MNFNNKKALYLQIVDIVIQKIANGEYKNGEKMLSIRELANLYAVNQNTVAHSYKELERLGIIETKRGLGYFVKENENFFNKLKNDKIEEQVGEFYHNMLNFGCTKDEIIEYIKEVEEC